jgi:PAS domain S-box-containing protein
MPRMIEPLLEQYTTALENYLANEGESALQQAYELGRRAIADGVGVLELASLHNHAMAALLADSADPARAGALAERAALFFNESLSPFEMMLSGYRETNARLQAKMQELESAERALQQQNQELAGAHRLVDAERLRYRELFEFAPGGYLVTDLGGVIREANRAALDLLGASQQLIGESLARFFSDASRGAFEEQLRSFTDGRHSRIEDLQVDVLSKNVDPVPVSLRAELVRDQKENAVVVRWLMSDITQSRRIEEERAQIRLREHMAQAEIEAARRLEFLAQASAVLASTLDARRICGSIARLPVPYLADFCVVHLCETSPGSRLTTMHVDRPYEELLGRLSTLVHAAMPPSMAVLLADRRPRFLADVSEEWMNDFAGTPESVRAIRELQLQSVLQIPLLGQEKALGIVTLGRVRGRAAFAPAERDLAAEFARWCSLVLDNALLHEQVVVERDKADKASQAKDEFVAVLSHELRNPLTAILGWLRVLKREQPNAEQGLAKDALEAVKHNSQQIARLVEDCMDIARITERRIQLHRETIDLNEIVRATLAANRDVAFNEEMHFLIHLFPERLWVSGDGTRLQQVVSNLLSNAVRYSSKGGLITVTSRREEGEAEIVVQDTGIGIAPDLLDQIFEPFRQGSHHWLASESGLGLGLAIARQIVQLHGGRIWAESQGPGLGSTFRLRLPLIVDQPQVAPAGSASATEMPRVSERRRVLFVEDSADILNLMRLELYELGFDVMTASTAEEGLEIARRESPHIVVSDIKMPGMDGYEFVKQLRTLPQLSSIPAIALTGFGMKQDVEKALASGYNAHLCKPVEIEQLATLITKLLTP